MALFGKKEPTEADIPQAPDGMPVDRVMQLRSQGFTNNQIISALQKDGFNSQQIFDAMKQADLSQTMGGPMQQEDPEMMMHPPPGINPGQKGPTPDFSHDDMGGVPPPGMPPPMGMSNMGYGMNSAMDSERIEQIAEAIIDEKWEEIAKTINRLIEWKESVESRVHSIEDDIKKIKQDFDRLHGSILGKIGEYDQNILNVGTEVKAMEKVFQKILPTLTDNVNQLSRITTGMQRQQQPAPKKGNNSR